MPTSRAIRRLRLRSTVFPDLDIAKFTCEDQTPDAARFTCTTAFPHEHYYFHWRRKSGTTYIDTISGLLED